MKKHLFLLIVVLALLLTACDSAADSQSATETIVPTSTKALSTLTATLTPRPATETPASTPVFDATAAAIANVVMTGSPPRLHASYPSPDDKWRVEIIIYDCVQVGDVDANAYEQLKLIEVSTGVTEVIDSQLQFCGGLGAAGLDGRLWSSNSQHFYYTDARAGVPDGLCGYWEAPLRRLDVTNGSVEHLGMGPLSPDSTKLATWQDSDFVVWSLDRGEIARSPALPAAAVRGPIVWSPDSDALVYLQTEDYCFLSGKSYVVRLDLPELSPELLIESTTPTFIGVTWDNPDQINLSDETGKIWTYDFETEDLRPDP